MPEPFDRSAITFDGKPVILFLDASPRLAQPFLARCQGVTLVAQDEGLGEDQYIERLIQTAAEMGLTATLRRQDDREIALDVKASPTH